MFNNNQDQEPKLNEEKTEDNKSKVVSITEAARMNNVTRQAIYVAIKLKKLKASKSSVSSRWIIKLEDLEKYKQEKYSRAKSTFDGELIFNPEMGYYSVNQAAKLLNVPAQKIYYATRIGVLKAHRKGAAWVIHIDDIQAYKEQLENKKNLVS